MKPTSELFLSEEILRQSLKVDRPSVTRFSIEMDPTELARKLYWIYKAEVESRGRQLEYSDDLRQLLEQCAGWLADPWEKPGLMLGGLYGNGKTTMMRSLARLVEYFAIAEALPGMNDYHYSEVLATDVARYGTSDAGLGELRKLAGRKVLYIDDLGMEPPEVLNYGVRYRPMEILLARRYDSRQLTIVTTNCDSKKLQKQYDPRTYDRMREFFRMVTFKGESYRRY